MKRPTISNQSLTGLNPLEIIAKGMDINPQITKRLFAVVVLIACVALIGQLVKDPTTAIIGGVLLVVASVILLVVAAISAQQIGTIAIWFCRFVSILFIAISLTLFMAWAFKYPQPLQCMINIYSPCGPITPVPVQTNIPGSQICLRSDQNLPPGSCGQDDGNYVVTNVRSDDPDHGLNVREGPDLSALAVGLLLPNATEVVVGTCKEGWCEVQCKAFKGWSRDRYLSLRTSVLYSVTGISQASIGLALRNGPDQTCGAVGSIPYNGQDIIVHSCQLSQDGGSRWCLATYNHRSGWVTLENLTRQKYGSGP
jgi:uncharacterized protein YraI